MKKRRDEEICPAPKSEEISEKGLTDWAIYGCNHQALDLPENGVSSLHFHKACLREADLALRRKADPVKMALARRLRRETTLPLKWICDRLALGSWQAASRPLYEQNVELQGTDPNGA